MIAILGMATSALAQQMGEWHRDNRLYSRGQPTDVCRAPQQKNLQSNPTAFITFDCGDANRTPISRIDMRHVAATGWVYGFRYEGQLNFRYRFHGTLSPPMADWEFYINNTWLTMAQLAAHPPANVPPLTDEQKALLIEKGEGEEGLQAREEAQRKESQAQGNEEGDALAAQLMRNAADESTAVRLPAAGGTPDKDPQMMKLLQEAQHNIESRNFAATIAKCDQVINAYKAHYGGTQQKIFCVRSREESVGLMMKAAMDKNNAVALSIIWSGAYYTKAYALEELGRMGEGKATLQEALKLSPFNAQYLTEMGQIYAREKNWSIAEQLYREAEDNAALSPPASRADDLAKARRGLGYVLVELGKLDEAEKKYQQCIATNPNDSKAKAELQYVREQKAKKG